MIHLAKVQLLIMWACLHITHVKGNVMSERSFDEKLIVVIPSVGYEDRPGMDCNAGECSGENETDSCVCSDRRNCLYTKFEDALNRVEDNTVIMLNDTLQEFMTNNMLNNITNISIIGFHKFIAINCHARGSIVFKNCKKIVIENITWISCGSNKDNRCHYGLIDSDGLPVLTYDYNFHDDFSRLYFYGLHFNSCTNVTLRSCSFEASMVGISEASGVVYIDQVHFLSTNAHDLPDVYPLATGLINQTNVQMENFLMVKVTNSLFSQSGRLNISENLLLFYMLLNDPDSTIQVLISQTNFSSASYDPGWAAECGMVCIQIVSYKDVYIEFNGVQFLFNKFRPEFFSLPLGLPVYHITCQLYFI